MSKHIMKGVIQMASPSARACHSPLRAAEMVFTWPRAPASGMEESDISLVSMPEVARTGVRCVGCVGRWELVTIPLLLELLELIGLVVVGVLLDVVEVLELEVAVVGRW